MSQFNGLLRRYIDMVNETSPTTVPPTATAMAAPAPAAAPASAGPVSPWPNDPAKDAAWKTMSPADQKWLGGADPTDKYILARAPNKGKPVAAPAAAPAALSAADQEDADQGAAMAANALAATQTANGVNAAGQNVTMPNGINPETGAPTTVTAGAPAAQQAARPRIPAKSDPAVLKIQQDLIAKGAKIKADGVMGPATQAAMKQFGQGAKPAPAAAPLPGKTPFPGAGQISDTPAAESVYREDQALARIVQLARG